MISQRLTAPKTGGGALVLSTAYGAYDGANRITSAAESGEGTTWSQSFSYGNQFGNLSITGDGDAPSLRCGSYDAANNRCNASGFGYDNAGNLTTYQGRTLTYDAENRQATLVDSGTTWTYSYDGEGRRVKKTGGGRTVVSVYDAMGRLAAEYDSAPPAGQPDCTTCFLTADHLGSTRLVTDSSGTVKRRYDYHPFGWEVNPGYGNRSTVTGYQANDPFSTKFTGKERDYESGLGLDYFGVRYMSSAQGRFTSPDPLVWQSWQTGNDDEQARFKDFISDPQNFNLYTYGRNNPLKYTDPTGLDVELAVNFVGDFSDEEKRRILAAVSGYLENLKVGKVVVRDAAIAGQDKRTRGQAIKDFFTDSNPFGRSTDFHGIEVNANYSNPTDKPWLVNARNMIATGNPDDFFGDLRKNDPGQWSNIVAQRVLHETISHAFGVGPDFDQLVLVGGDRGGTLIQGSYGRGHSGIPGLNPADTAKIQKLLVPRKRSYVP